MRRFICFYLCLASCMALFAQATDLTIDNQTPGWLSSKINYGDQQTVKNLKITGYINNTDLNFIGTLIQKNLNGCVDLYHANMVAEGSTKDNELTATNAGLFGLWGGDDCNYKLQSCYLPNSATNVNIVIRFPVDTLLFDTQDSIIERSSITIPHVQHLTIGESVKRIHSSNFTGKILKSVSLPTSLRIIEDFAFDNSKNSFVLEDQNLSANIDSLVNLEYLGFAAFTRITSASLPDSLFLPSIKEFSTGTFPLYKKNMHIFLGESLENFYHPSKTSYTYMTTPSLKDVYFHIASKKMIGITSAITNTTFYVPKELLEDYKKQRADLVFKAEPVPLRDIDLDKENLVLEVNEEMDLIAIPVPLNADDPNMAWSVDKPEILSVSQFGHIKALTSGKAIITVSSSDGNVKHSCEVIVKTHAANITLNPTNLIITNIGNTTQLQSIVLPEETYDKSVRWSSSNPSVCTVTASGKVVAMGYGEAVIMAVTNDGDLPATCVVKVVRPKHKLTYIVDGTEYQSNEYETGEAISLIAAPEKENYMFVGWSLTMPTDDVSLTAIYAPATSVGAIQPTSFSSFQVFTPDGIPMNTLQKGVNIIHYSDGQTKKVFIK